MTDNRTAESTSRGPQRNDQRGPQETDYAAVLREERELLVRGTPVSSATFVKLEEAADEIERLRTIEAYVREVKHRLDDPVFPHVYQSGIHESPGLCFGCQLRNGLARVLGMKS